MYLESLKEEFYQFLTGKRICLMVHYDIDSICACKILQNLLEHNQTLYTLAIIQGVKDLKNEFLEHCNDVKLFVLINCGGTVDVVDLLEPDDDIIFFILDSHRPTDLHNIFSIGQVRLLWDAESDGDVPEFNSVFLEDDESEGEEGEHEHASEDSETEDQTTERHRLRQEDLIKRREKRLWEDKRNDIMFEYTKFSYYSRASALYMFELAWKLSRDDKDILWYAIVALSEQILFEKIESIQYVLETSNLQAHATRLQNRSNDADDSTSLKIKFEKDLKLVLYRHWSVEDSLKHSMTTACKLKLWSIRGDKQLQELLAEMGFPLVQSRQNYLSMDLLLRQEFLGAMEKLSERHGLADIIYTTFTLSYGYRNKYCALDVVYGMLSLLEYPSAQRKPEESFQMALHCLSRSNNNILNAAIEKGKAITISLFNTVKSAVKMNKIILAGPYIYYILIEGSPDVQMFSYPHILNLLAQFILRAYVAMTRNDKASVLPLVVFAPKAFENDRCVVLGISPLAESSTKNFFGKAFEQITVNPTHEPCDYFDVAYTNIHIKDRPKFLDALTTVLR